VFARAVACAALGGLAIGMGGAPYEAFAVAWLGPAFVHEALRALSGPREGVGAPPDRHALRRAAAVGLSAGLVANGTTCAWVVDLLVTYASMPTPIAWLVAALLFVAQSLPFVLATTLCRAMLGLGAPLVPSFVVASLAGASTAPMIFPWRVGSSQTGFLALAQIAELGGLPLLDLVLSLGSVLALRGVLERRASLVLGAAAILGLPAAWGLHRLDEVRRDRALLPTREVGVVQHAFDVPERHDPLQWELQMATTWQLTREVERRGVDLVLWPESAFPWTISRPLLHRLADDLDLRGNGVRGPIVFGAGTRDPAHAFNSVLAVDGDRVLGVVDKTRLMPFSERIPLWEYLLFLHPYLGPGLEPGPPEGGTLEVAGARLGILNCYEDLMADHVWRVAQADPDLLSNHTNDAWFGRTRAPELHHFLARMRAIETRRDLVRTVNTGVSGVVLATGETSIRSRVFERTTLRATVRLSRARTPWVRWGDWLTPGAWGAVLAGLVVLLRRGVFHRGE
jgi:apolipoprotein N-acyltransferase